MSATHSSVSEHAESAHVGYRMPDGYVDLQQRAAEVAGDGTMRLDEVAALISDIDATMSNEEVDRYRYGYFAKTLGRFAHSLYGPDGGQVREELIDFGVRRLLVGHAEHSAKHRVPPFDGLYLDEAVIRGGSNEALPSLTTAVAGLSPGDKLLAGIMQTLRGGRSIKGEDGTYTYAEHTQYDPTILALDAIGSTETETQLTDVFLTGASIVMRHAIREHARRGWRRLIPEFVRAAGHPLVKSVITKEKLYSRELTVTASRAASLHLEELRHLSSMLTRHSNGTIELKPESIPKHPVIDKPEDYMHQSRLSCPAQYVARLIGSVVKLIPEVIVRADDEIVRGNYPKQQSTPRADTQ